MKDIIIIGAGGYAREVLMLIDSINAENPQWRVLGFVESTSKNRGNLVQQYKVLGDLSYIKKSSAYVICAIGDSKIRKKVLDSIKLESNRYPILIHPSAIVGDNVIIGEGTVIFPNTIITTDVTVGKHVFLSLNSLISHDSEIGDYSTLLPGCKVSGNVNIGNLCTLGTGSTVIQGINIGEKAYVGAGAVVIDDVVKNTLVVGVPAKKVKVIDRE